MFKRIPYIIFYFSLLLSFSESEKIVYNVKYNGIKAGQAILEKTLDENNINISFNLKSRKIFDFIYKLRENILIKADKLEYHIYEIKKVSQHGKYHKKFHAIFDYIKNIGSLNNIDINISNKIYDPISIIYHLRNSELHIDKIFNYSIISKNNPKNLNIKVVGEEEISVKNKKYNCFILEADGDRTKKGFLKLWISKGEGNIPVIIEKRAKNGTIKMELQNIYINE